MKKPRRTSECGFLKLPAELRNRIYALGLIYKRGIDTFTFARPRRFLNSNNWRYKANKVMRFHVQEPSLLRTCKEVRKEALPMFYGGNIFGHLMTMELDGRTQWQPWLLNLTSEKRRMLNTVHVRHYSSLAGLGVNTNGVRTLKEAHAWMEEKGIIVKKEAFLSTGRKDLQEFWTNQPNEDDDYEDDVELESEDGQ